MTAGPYSGLAEVRRAGGRAMGQRRTTDADEGQRREPGPSSASWQLVGQRRAGAVESRDYRASIRELAADGRPGVTCSTLESLLFGSLCMAAEQGCCDSAAAGQYRPCRMPMSGEGRVNKRGRLTSDVLHRGGGGGGGGVC
ncbi:hypothetical protein VFPBJ_02835 [Purpureocillium lilacinum]|uniref:Uncharacterized protein n=2 Tax=Purpureocillium lilacinum TaxID=33203 RepID=A0A179H1E7_PURLI|nr:hypothetical protein VFPBJ_02835 [Purpureocillium lilacinum]